MLRRRIPNVSLEDLHVSDPALQRRIKNYASPRFGMSLVLTCVDFVVLYLYNDLYQLRGILAGTAAAVGKVAIAASSFVAGYTSDHTHSRWGNRRPYLLFGSPVLMLAFTGLFLPTWVLGTSAPETHVFLWYLGFNVAFQATYGFVWSAYHSLMPTLVDVEHRPAASMWQNVFNYLSSGVGIAYTFVGVTEFTDAYEETGVLHPGFALVFAGFGLLMVVLFFRMHRVVPVAPGEFERTEDDLLSNFRTIWSNKNYLNVTLVHGVMGLAASMQTSLLYGYAQKVLKLEGWRLYLVAAALILGVLGFVGAWRRMIEAKGKKRTLQAIFIVQITTMPLTCLGLLGLEPLSFGLAFMAAMTCGMAGWALFPYIMYADVAEDHARRTGEQKSGLFHGFSVVPLNVFQAISLVITGALLDLPLVAGTDYSWGYVLWGPLGSAYVVASYLLLRWRVKLDYDWESSKSQSPSSSSWSSTNASDASAL
ncbi:MAG: MFS transporter [Promethearchaeota archaeon]